MYKEAINAFNEAINIESDNTYSLHHKGLTIFKYKPEEECDKLTKIAHLNSIGFTLYFNKKYLEAIEIFEYVLNFNPRDSYALHYKGLSLFNLGEDEKKKNGITEKVRKLLNESINSFEKVILINPEDSDAYYKVGFAFFELNKYEAAINFFEQTLDKNPKHFYASHKKGLALHRLQQYDDAMKAFDKALEMNPEFTEVRIDKGKLYYNLQKYTDAIQEFDKAIEKNPENFDVLYHKGLASREGGLYTEAIDAFKKALDLRKDDDGALKDLALTFLARQNYKDSVKILKSVKDYEKKPLILNTLGWVYLIQDECYKAIDYFEKALKIEPENFDFWLAKGISLIHQNKYLEAMNPINEAIKYSSQNPYNAARAWNEKGYVLLMQEKSNEAIDAFNKSLWNYPKYFYAWNNLGRAFYYRGQYNKAFEFFNKTLEIKKDRLEDPDPYTLFYKGLILRKLGKLEQSLETLEEGIRFSELKNVSKTIFAKIDRKVEIYLWYHKGCVLFDFRRFDETLKAFDKAIEKSKDIEDPNILAEIMFKKGLVFERLGNSYLAQKSYTEALNEFEKKR